MPSVYAGGGGARLIDQSQLQSALQGMATRNVARDRNKMLQQRQEWEREDRARKQGYRDAAQEFYAKSLAPLLTEREASRFANPATQATLGTLVNVARGYRYDENGLFWQDPSRDIAKLERAAALREVFARMDPADMPRAKLYLNKLGEEEAIDEQALRLAQQASSNLKAGNYFAGDVETGQGGEPQYTEDEDAAIADEINALVEQLKDPDTPWTQAQLTAIGQRLTQLRNKAAEQRSLIEFRDAEVARATAYVDQYLQTPTANRDFAALARAEIEKGRRDGYPPEKIFDAVDEKLRFGNFKEFVLQWLKTRDEFDEQSMLEYLEGLFNQKFTIGPVKPPPPDPNVPDPTAPPAGGGTTPDPTGPPLPPGTTADPTIPSPPGANVPLPAPSDVPEEELAPVVDRVAELVAEGEDFTGEAIDKILTEAGIDAQKAIKDSDFISRLSKEIAKKTKARRRRLSPAGRGTGAASWAMPIR